MEEGEELLSLTGTNGLRSRCPVLCHAVSYLVLNGPAPLPCVSVTTVCKTPSIFLVCLLQTQPTHPPPCPTVCLRAGWLLQVLVEVAAAGSHAAPPTSLSQWTGKKPKKSMTTTLNRYTHTGTNANIPTAPTQTHKS